MGFGLHSSEGLDPRTQALAKASKDLARRPSPGLPAAQVPVRNLGQAQPAPGDLRYKSCAGSFRGPFDGRFQGFWCFGFRVRGLGFRAL